MANETVYNWGIIGCGKISADFAQCLKHHSRSKIVACGARSLSKSRKFAKKFDIPTYNAYDSYDAVSKDPNVDIVYIGTIHPSHCKSVIFALNNNKHVLCEKPIGMNAKETQSMIDAAHKNQCFLMEAMWTRFFPAIKKVRQLIKEDAIGEIVSFYNGFGVLMPSASEVPRLWEKQLGGGAILDLGCYTVNPLTWIFGPRMPSKIAAAGYVDKEHGIDSISAATVIYSDTKSLGQINCQFYGTSFEEFLIVGKKGRIRVEKPAHCPRKITIETDGQKQSFEFKNNENVMNGNWNFPGSEGLIYQIQAVTQCLDEGRTQCPEYTLDEMLVTMKIMDEIRRQVGVQYKQDAFVKSKL